MAGFVLDLQEQPMAGVVVSLRNRTIGFEERAVTTDATGKFTFPNLAPAEDYLLQAAFPGFATIEIRIEIRPGRRTTQHISMRPERDLAEVIEVVEKSNIVQLEDTDLLDNTDKENVGTYTQITFNANLFIGRAVRIEVSVTTDASAPTKFRIDDVSLKTD